MKKDWNLPGKKEIKNSYGYYYYIDDSAINLFLEGKLNDKIKKEKEYILELFLVVSRNIYYFLF